MFWTLTRNTSLIHIISHDHLEWWIGWGYRFWFFLKNLSVFLFRYPNCWNYSCVSPHSLLRMDPRTLCMQGKYSTNWAASLAHDLFLDFWETWYELWYFTGSMRPVGHSDRYIQAIILNDLKHQEYCIFMGLSVSLIPGYDLHLCKYYCIRNLKKKKVFNLSMVWDL